MCFLKLALAHQGTERERSYADVCRSSRALAIVGSWRGRVPVTEQASTKLGLRRYDESSECATARQHNVAECSLLPTPERTHRWLCRRTTINVPRVNSKRTKWTSHRRHDIDDSNKNRYTYHLRGKVVGWVFRRRPEDFVRNVKVPRLYFVGGEQCLHHRVEVA